MNSYPLVNEQVEAGESLIQQFRSSWPIEAAFRLNPSSEGPWEFYLAVRGLDKKTIYGDAIQIAQAMKTPYLDSMRVRIIRVSDPLAVSAIKVNQEYQGDLATRLRGRLFGDVAAEEVYIYQDQHATAKS